MKKKEFDILEFECVIVKKREYDCIVLLSDMMANKLRQELKCFKIHDNKLKLRSKKKKIIYHDCINSNSRVIMRCRCFSENRELPYIEPLVVLKMDT